MSSKFTLKDHIIHHEILGVGSGSGGSGGSANVAANPPLFTTTAADGYTTVINIPQASASSDGYISAADYSFFASKANSTSIRIWQYQDFTGPVTGPLTLSAFENGTGLSFVPAYIVGGTATVVLPTQTSRPPTTTTAIPGRWLPANRVEVSSHTGTSVTLNQDPDSGLDVRVYYLIDLPVGVDLPTDYIEAPKFIRLQRLEFLDESFVNQEGNETLYNTKTFAGTARVDGYFQLTPGAEDGYVLTSDASGFGTWAPTPLVQATAPTSFPGRQWIRSTDYETFIFDQNRGKWISPRTVTYGAGRNANNASNIYLRSFDRVATSATPLIIPFDSTLIGMTASTTSAETWSAQVHIANSLVVGAALAVTAATSAVDMTLNIDFSAGDEIQIFASGTGLSRPHVNLYFAKRGS